VGFDSIAGYLNSTETYYSALVGRYANRIAEGKFQLDGRKYQLAINNAPNHLHGGPQGFHKQVWEIKKGSDNTIELYYFSKDGEENYPGNLEVTVIYSLTDDNELVIAYKATTDAPTIINLTSHPFFNLNGQGSGTIEKHVLQIEADHYNPVFENLIPRGIEKVANTPFDFRKAKTIGQDIQDQNLQLIFGAGYDHNYILNGQGFRKVARVQGDRSGIVMEVLTNQPGMQFYSVIYL
jgi:aldose 1-epimerase